MGRATSVCKFPGCDRPRYKTQTVYCQQHYRRHDRNGNPGWTRDPAGVVRLASDAPKGWPKPDTPEGRKAVVERECVRVVEGWWPLPMPDVPEAPESGWRDRAACAGMDVDLFFPGQGQVPPVEVIAACHACPVRGSCVADGRRAHWSMQVGVRGGMSNYVWARLSNGRRAKRRAQHGTPAAYRQHYRDGEKPCAVCVDGTVGRHNQRRTA